MQIIKKLPPFEQEPYKNIAYVCMTMTNIGFLCKKLATLNSNGECWSTNSALNRTETVTGEGSFMNYVTLEQAWQVALLWIGHLVSWPDQQTSQQIKIMFC